MTDTPTLRPALPHQLAASAPLVTVVGDVLLDVWVYGTSVRLAREAPAPVVDQSYDVFAAGGAANTAMNLAALGARVRIVGVVGADEPGHRLRTLLEDGGVDTTLLVEDPGGTTTTKSRIVVGDQVMCRLDRTAAPPGVEALRDVEAALSEAVRDSRAVIVCDYGAAVHRDELVGSLAEALDTAPDRPFTVVDAHEPQMWAPLRPDLVTPNAQEAASLLRTDFGDGSRRIGTVTAHSTALLHRTGASRVVVTLDRDGAVLVDGSGLLHRTWANPAAEKQAAGAGDTFVAALALARSAELPDGSRLSDAHALDFAQAAADVVVHRLGTSLCTTEDLAAHLSDAPDVLVPAHELAAEIAELRAAGARIVLTNGCFDVLHRGHTSYLNKSAQLGDVLVVAVNDDASAQRLKGPDRPLNELQDRAGVLAALHCVDFVTAFSTDTPIPLITALRPDVYVKGGDYTPEMLAETPVVEQYGGQVRIMEYVSDHSTSLLLERMQSGSRTVDPPTTETRHPVAGPPTADSPTRR
ncbi:D-glycero-beta-D-manno-heptose 1-phosphate adenylyltransferase [Brevibacterium yomogidense]|uniref:D-glycero-beta-D-manno-heptose 1-phosphate adenylyltransferase n=1 Tax=Brevibacterium yomogidense TaxID=946573 RepID=UPI0018DF0293|nr:D-glycero-beta-D-manno-heptose 1-phosphate adenylyltransferase [Brevibacterium yomogidense]